MKMFLRKIIEFFKSFLIEDKEMEKTEKAIEILGRKLPNADKKESASKRKRYVCKDGRVLYPVRCRKCNKRTTTSDKETAARNLYVCRKCVPRKKKTINKK